MVKNFKINTLWTIKEKDLLYLIKLRSGGETTAKIIDLLLEQPYNKNQLANILKVDYNTISYHLAIMCKYKMMIEEKVGKQYYYRPSDKLINNIEDYILIKNSMKNKK
ncbi:ArsR/SmtB family transcription factor [Methanobrevibacter sp.]